MDVYLDEKNNPWVVISLRLLEKSDIKCILDTGFSGGIALPKYYLPLVAKKTPLFSERFEFASGEVTTFPIYTTPVRCQKKSFNVKLMFIDNTTPLVGISFLKHYKLELDIPNKLIALKNFVKTSDL